MENKFDAQTNTARVEILQRLIKERCKKIISVCARHCMTFSLSMVLVVAFIFYLLLSFDPQTPWKRVPMCTVKKNNNPIYLLINVFFLQGYQKFLAASGRFDIFCGYADLRETFGLVFKACPSGSSSPSKLCCAPCAQLIKSVHYADIQDVHLVCTVQFKRSIDCFTNFINRHSMPIRMRFWSQQYISQKISCFNMLLLTCVQYALVIEWLDITIYGYCDSFTLSPSRFYTSDRSGGGLIKQWHDWLNRNSRELRRFARFELHQERKVVILAYSMQLLVVACRCILGQERLRSKAQNVWWQNAQQGVLCLVHVQLSSDQNDCVRVFCLFNVMLCQAVSHTSFCPCRWNGWSSSLPRSASNGRKLASLNAWKCMLPVTFGGPTPANIHRVPHR